MSTQLPLAFKTRPDAALENFFPASNQAILSAINNLLQQKANDQLYLSGAQNCGKTHLLMAACQLADTLNLSNIYLPLKELGTLSPLVLQDLATLDFIAIDDLQAIAGNKDWEIALFNFFNQTRDQGCRLLFSANCGPAALPIQLADLKSRLAWGAAWKINALNDDEKLAFLLKNAQHRGLELKLEAANWLISRHARDLPSLLQAMDKLDHASMTEQRKLTLPFVKSQLKKT